MIVQDVILDITSRPCIIVFVINKLTTERGNNYENILFIVGSLRQGSFNHQMAKKAESLLEGKATVTYLTTRTSR